MQTRIVTVPGYHGSDADHWQTWLEQQFPDIERLSGVDWESPQLYTWAEALEKQLDQKPDQVLLVGHSFGSLVSALVASWRPEKVAGLILVAPASPNRFSLYGSLAEGSASRGNILASLPAHRLNTLGVLVGSKNDPWMTLNEAENWSQRWGLAFYNAGLAGHINSASGYGEWPLIKDFVSALLEAVEPLPGDEVFQLGSWNSTRHNPVTAARRFVGIPAAPQDAFLKYA